MKNRISVILAAVIILTACSPSAPAAATPTPVNLLDTPIAGDTQPAGVTPTQTLSGQMVPPTGGTGLVSNMDPLTGLVVTDPRLLARRPLVVKVENLPRGRRPQWGLSQADLVYEYYTEEGSSRFAAVFYGQDVARVGPIRSGLFFDANVVDMYKAIFAFGSAYADVLNRFKTSDFASRMVVEETNNCPPMCRFEPNGANDLVTNTAQLSAYAAQKGIPNGAQNLQGMAFSASVPAGGKPAPQVFVRFSGAIYNRWDYDPTSGKYLRWVDAQDDLNSTHEVYVKLPDRGTGQQIAADNLVIILVPYTYYARTATTQVFDVNLIGTGPAYAVRDGQIYAVQWKRMNTADVLTFVDAAGNPFPLKPGNTWIEVLHSDSTVKQTGNSWRFTFVMPQ